MIKIETNRLFLITIDTNDTKAINAICNEEAVATKTLSIPHPCPMEFTKKFIDTFIKAETEKSIVLTIVLKPTNAIIGLIGLQIEPLHERAELGYFLQQKYWGNGYGTEAAKASVEYGFIQRKLNRIYAQTMQDNKASSKVLLKIGMQYEGCFKEHIKRDGVYKTLENFAILRKEYNT